MVNLLGFRTHTLSYLAIKGIVSATYSQMAQKKVIEGQKDKGNVVNVNVLESLEKIT